MGELKQISKGRRIAWYSISWISCSLAYFCLVNLVVKYITNPLITQGRAISIGAAFGALVVAAYHFFLEYVICTREPTVPCKLRPPVKRLFDCLFVVVCSCWGYYYTTSSSSVVAVGLLLCFHVLPTLNVWWGFVNFSLLDCCVAILIETAVFFCSRSRHGVLFIGLTAVVGVALQWKKNDYQQQQTAIDEEKKMN